MRSFETLCNIARDDEASTYRLEFANIHDILDHTIVDRVRE